MAKLVDRLTALMVARKKTPGFYPDGKGLHLKVGPTGAKSWALRYTLRGRTRWMGLGPCDLVSPGGGEGTLSAGSPAAL